MRSIYYVKHNPGKKRILIIRVVKLLRTVLLLKKNIYNINKFTRFRLIVVISVHFKPGF